MSYSDKEKAALEYHERQYAMFKAMEGKSELIRKIAKETNSQLWETTMDKDQLLLKAKLNASLSAAAGFDALRRLFTWAAKRCDDANTYFLAQSTKYRK